MKKKIFRRVAVYALSALLCAVFMVLPSFAADYTNVLASATGSDGNILNGSGYVASSRINSSGEVVSGGMFVSGFMPCKVGDLVRLQNVSFARTSSNYTGGSLRICFYTVDKTLIAMAQSASNTDPETMLDAVYDDSENLSEFTVKAFSSAETWSNLGYFRICADMIDETSIITVNEEIISTSNGYVGAAISAIMVALTSFGTGVASFLNDFVSTLVFTTNAEGALVLTSFASWSLAFLGLSLVLGLGSLVVYAVKRKG